MTETTDAATARPTLDAPAASAGVALADEPGSGEAAGHEVAVIVEAADGDPGLGASGAVGNFAVHLDNFEGPFDLLLGLISKHKLDVTEVALSQVTDEFIAYIRAAGEEWDLGQATEFLVVASTLLDLKTARLLPSADVEDEEDLALLEARDLLFARLLQYRAYKDVSAEFARRIAAERLRFPRAVSLDQQFSTLLPEVLLGLGPSEFALLAARALAPKAPPMVAVDHVHAPRVSVREQGAILIERLRIARASTFRALVADCPDTLTVVARFLALLELFREGVVAFEQVAALGELHVRWTGADDADVAVTDEFDLDPSIGTETDDGPPADEVDERTVAMIGRPTTDPEDPR